MKKETRLIEIAEALKPQGIKGEIKVLPLTDDAPALSRVKKVIVEGEYYSVEKIRAADGYCYVKLSGVDDRNAAEKFRGLTFFTDTDNRPPLPKDRFYIADVIGLTVTDGVKDFGVITDVLQYGAADVYAVKGADGNNFMFPATKNVIEEYDICEKKLLIRGDALLEVAVYED